MTTPSNLAPALSAIPRGCLCRHVDGTIGHVWPDVRVDRSEAAAVVLGKYRMAIADANDPRDTAWRLDIDRVDLHVLTLEEAQEHEKRQRDNEKIRRVIATAYYRVASIGSAIDRKVKQARSARMAVIDTVCVEVRA